MIGSYLKIYCIVQSQMNRIQPKISEIWDDGQSQYSTNNVDTYIGQNKKEVVEMTGFRTNHHKHAQDRVDISPEYTDVQISSAYSSTHPESQNGQESGYSEGSEVSGDATHLEDNSTTHSSDRQRLHRTCDVTEVNQIDSDSDSLSGSYQSSEKSVQSNDIDGDIVNVNQILSEDGTDVNYGKITDSTPIVDSQGGNMEDEIMLQTSLLSKGHEGSLPHKLKQVSTDIQKKGQNDLSELDQDINECTCKVTQQITDLCQKCQEKAVKPNDTIISNSLQFDPAPENDYISNDLLNVPSIKIENALVLQRTKLGSHDQDHEDFTHIDKCSTENSDTQKPNPDNNSYSNKCAINSLQVTREQNVIHNSMHLNPNQLNTTASSECDEEVEFYTTPVQYFNNGANAPKLKNSNYLENFSESSNDLGSEVFQPVTAWGSTSPQSMTKIEYPDSRIISPSETQLDFNTPLSTRVPHIEENSAMLHVSNQTKLEQDVSPEDVPHIEEYFQSESVDNKQNQNLYRREGSPVHYLSIVNSRSVRCNSEPPVPHSTILINISAASSRANTPRYDNMDDKSITGKTNLTSSETQLDKKACEPRKLHPVLKQNSASTLSLTEPNVPTRKRNSVVFKLYDDEILPDDDPNIVQIIPKLQAASGNEETTDSSGVITTETTNGSESSNKIDLDATETPSRRHTQQWAKKHFNVSRDYSTSSLTSTTKLKRVDSARTWNSDVSTTSKRSRRTSSLTRQLRENKALRMTAAVIGAFILCILPYKIVFMLRVTNVGSVSDLVWNVVNAIMFTSNVLNPFIYNFYNSSFRRAITAIIKCRKTKVIPV